MNTEIKDKYYAKNISEAYNLIKERNSETHVEMIDIKNELIKMNDLLNNLNERFNRSHYEDSDSESEDDERLLLFDSKKNNGKRILLVNSSEKRISPSLLSKIFENDGENIDYDAEKIELVKNTDENVKLYIKN